MPLETGPTQLLPFSQQACTADGYSFPTNLDTDPPLQGLAPPTGQQLMLQALNERWLYETFADRVAQLGAKRQG